MRSCQHCCDRASDLRGPLGATTCPSVSPGRARDTCYLTAIRVIARSSSSTMASTARTRWGLGRRAAEARRRGSARGSNAARLARSHVLVGLARPRLRDAHQCQTQRRRPHAGFSRRDNRSGPLPRRPPACRAARAGSRPTWGQGACAPATAGHDRERSVAGQRACNQRGPAPTLAIFA